MNTSENLFFSELLAQFRKRKRLNQKQLAERIEVSRETISLWERGEYKPEADRMLYKIVDVLGLTSQEQQQLFEAYTVTALATSFHNPPLERNPYFTGRRPQLTDLHTLLMAGKQVALTQAISGLGGIGKTQLALEYAYCYQKSYHDIFWASADTYGSLTASYVQLAAILHLPEYDEQDQNKIKVAVQQWLGVHKRWLLILDNVEDLNLIHQFVPKNRQGSVLLTTRRQVTEPVAQALELGLLPENDAILFLLKRTKVLAVDKSLEDASNRDIEAVRAITQALGNLPLALDQAGAYILETQCGFAAYLDLFKKHQAELLRRRVGDEIPTDHPESVTTTFTLNFQQVQQRSKVAGELLRICVFLASDDIGEEIFMQGADKLGPILHPLGSDSLLLNQAIEVLRTFSLIRRDADKKTISTHKLIQAVLHDIMTEQEREKWVQQVIETLDAIFPDVIYEAGEQRRRLLPHVLACAATVTSERQSLELASLFHKAANYSRERAQYEQAEPLYRQASLVREHLLGPQHPSVAYPLNNLAEIYREQGKYAEAELLYQRALQIFEQALGPQHPSVAYPLNNLAEIYREQGKYAEAELLYQRALQIFEQALGPQHPQVTYPLNGLAILYYEQGKYAEAEPLYQRALRIREQALGPEHLRVAYPLAGLAKLYCVQGKYAEAEPLYQRALRIREQTLGSEHPDIVYPLAGLAELYYEQDKYAEAEPLFRRVLHIREQQVEPEHPETAEIMHTLTKLQEAQGNSEKAKALYAHTLAVRDKSLGAHHPKTMETRKHLIALLYTTGQHDEAAQLELAHPEQGTSEEKGKIY
jgi:tetratricopeptide (TPR) repeat protein